MYQVHKSNNVYQVYLVWARREKTKWSLEELNEDVIPAPWNSYSRYRQGFPQPVTFLAVQDSSIGDIVSQSLIKRLLI